MINTAPPTSNSVYGREKLFWYDKINFPNLGKKGFHEIIQMYYNTGKSHDDDVG